MGDTEWDETGWYDTRWGRRLYWSVLLATLVGVVASVRLVDFRLPPVVYLYGFLGATVYAFTSFAKQFGEDGRYRLKILSRTVAVLPLAAGVYLLAFAFPEVSGDLSALNVTTAGDESVTAGDRLVAGLVFLTGIYVSASLKALGGLAERLFGVETSDESTAEESTGGESTAEESKDGTEETVDESAERTDDDDGNGGRDDEPHGEALSEPSGDGVT